MLTCILREISTKPRGMLTHLDWSSITAPGLYLMPTALLRYPSPTAFSGFLFPTPSLAFPCPLPVASKISLFRFVPKQAKRSSAWRTPFIVLHILSCTCIGFHPGRVEPAYYRASTAFRTIAFHVRWSWAWSYEMASQSRFHRRRPTTWGPDSAARSFLIVLAHRTCFRKWSGEKYIADEHSRLVNFAVTIRLVVTNTRF